MAAHKGGTFLAGSAVYRAPSDDVGRGAERARTGGLTVRAHMGADHDDTPRPPESWASSEAIRRTMTSTRGRDTKPEVAVRSAVHRRGLRFRVDAAPLPGLRRRADLLFTRQKVAVFVDGCWWHGCSEHSTVPQANRDYWTAKIEGNRARDRDTDSRLLAAGWAVLRIWEHIQPEHAADLVEAAVRPQGLGGLRG